MLFEKINLEKLTRQELVILIQDYRIIMIIIIPKITS
jgi:hypothetical protein